MSKTFKILGMSLLALALLFDASASRAEDRSRDKERLERFEKKVDELRALLGIPGMSAVIVKDQRVLGARGFGFADEEASRLLRSVSRDTPSWGRRERASA